MADARHSNNFLCWRDVRHRTRSSHRRPAQKFAGHDPDAKQTVASWGAEEYENVEWLRRLSRGEYSELEFLGCLSTDQEETGDWDGALSTYQKIVGLCRESRYDLVKAYSNLASTYALLGQYDSALAAYRLATKNSKDKLRIRTPHYIAHEADLLSRLGFTRRAARLVWCQLAAYGGGTMDYYSVAKLYIIAADCELTRNRPASSAGPLQAAWPWLEAILQHSDWLKEQLDQHEEGRGIHIPFVWWWITESDRRRLANEGGTELAALENAIEKARQCFWPCGWQGLRSDLRLMQVLLKAAEAYDRHNRPAEATAFRSEAEEIFKRRRFPEATKLSTAFLKRLP